MIHMGDDISRNGKRFNTSYPKKQKQQKNQDRVNPESTAATVTRMRIQENLLALRFGN
jgi:hypothetical protein